MKFIADKLEEMDKSFSTKKESEKWLMILGVAGLITIIAYNYLLPYSESVYEVSEAEKNRLNKSVAEKNQYLSSITIGGDINYYIKQFDRTIEDDKQSIVQLKKKIAYINSSLNKLSPMLFNQRSWAVFLNSIAANARMYNVKINFIKNKYTNTKGSFGHVLEVEVESSGNFKDMVKFLNVLEQNTLVTDIYNSHLMGSDEGITSDINISVWGINH